MASNYSDDSQDQKFERGLQKLFDLLDTIISALLILFVG